MKTPSELLQTMTDDARRIYEKLMFRRKYVEVFVDHPAGRQVLQDILQRTGVLSVTHRDDPAKSAFLEGRRSVGLEIMGLLRILDEQDVLRIALARDDGSPATKAETFFQKNFVGHEDRS